MPRAASAMYSRSSSAGMPASPWLRASVRRSCSVRSASDRAMTRYPSISQMPRTLMTLGWSARFLVNSRARSSASLDPFGEADELEGLQCTPPGPVSFPDLAGGAFTEEFAEDAVAGNRHRKPGRGSCETTVTSIRVGASAAGLADGDGRAEGVPGVVVGMSRHVGRSIAHRKRMTRAEGMKDETVAFHPLILPPSSFRLHPFPVTLSRTGGCPRRRGRGRCTCSRRASRRGRRGGSARRDGGRGSPALPPAPRSGRGRRST